MEMFDVRHLALSGLAVCFTIGLGALTMAQNSGSGEVKSIQLSQREIIEKLDGKDARATWSVVTIAAGQKDSAHRHTGPVFGYVLEGEYVRMPWTTSWSRPTRPEIRSTNRRAPCTEWPKTRAARPRPAFSQ